jgi:hypothetical protein
LNIDDHELLSCQGGLAVMNLSTSIEPGNGRLAAKVENEWISRKIFAFQSAKHSALHINNQERTFQYTGNPLSSLLDLAFRRHVVKRPLDLLVPGHLSSVGHVGGSAEDLGLGGDIQFLLGLYSGFLLSSS